jgi:2-keto-3-deoxy-L-rhamnonate aldolase RhmA
MRAADAESLIVVKIESALAVRNVDAIVSVAGIDVVLIGHTDLSLSLGPPLQLDHRTSRPRSPRCWRPAAATARRRAATSRPAAPGSPRASAWSPVPPTSGSSPAR